MGRFLHESEVYTEAVEHYNLSLKTLGNSSRDTLGIIIRNQLGEIHLFLKNYEKAREYLTGSKNLAEALGYKRGIAIVESTLGTCYEKEKNYLQALEHQQKSLVIYREINDPTGIAIVQENIGSIYEDLGEFEKAFDFFTRSFEHFNTVKSLKRIQVLNNIGDIYRKTNDYEQALIHTRQALELAQEYGESHQVESALKDLSEVYALMGDFENSYNYLKAYSNVYKESFYSENFRQINILQTIHDTKQKEAHIALLQQQNEVSKADQKLLALGAGLLLALSGVSYFHFSRKRKGKLELQEYEQHLLQAKLDQNAIVEKKMQDEINIKTASLSKYSLNIAQKNKLMSDLSCTLKNISTRPNMNLTSQIKQLVKELDDHLQKEEQWDEFLTFFKDIHPEFIKNLSGVSEGSLSSAELRLAMLLRLNLSSKEIAAILRVTPDSVRVARYRLRKKLPIEPKQELVNFMLDL